MKEHARGKGQNQQMLWSQLNFCYLKEWPGEQWESCKLKKKKENKKQVGGLWSTLAVDHSNPVLITTVHSGADGLPLILVAGKGHVALQVHLAVYHWCSNASYNSICKLCHLGKSYR